MNFFKIISLTHSVLCDHMRGHIALTFQPALNVSMEQQQIPQNGNLLLNFTAVHKIRDKTGLTRTQDIVKIIKTSGREHN